MSKGYPSDLTDVFLMDAVRKDDDRPHSALTVVLFHALDRYNKTFFFLFFNSCG